MGLKVTQYVGRTYARLPSQGVKDTLRASPSMTHHQQQQRTTILFITMSVSATSRRVVRTLAHRVSIDWYVQ